jgi:hypothetical protein
LSSKKESNKEGNSLRLSWWNTPIILRLRGLRQEDHEFKFTLGYTVRPCLRNKKGKRSFTNIIKHIRIRWRQILSVLHIDIEKFLLQISPWVRHSGIHL